MSGMTSTIVGELVSTADQFFQSAAVRGQWLQLVWLQERTVAALLEASHW